MLKAVDLNTIIMVIQLMLKYEAQQNILKHKIQQLVLPHTRATILSPELILIFKNFKFLSGHRKGHSPFLPP